MEIVLISLAFQKFFFNEYFQYISEYLWYTSLGYSKIKKKLIKNSAKYFKFDSLLINIFFLSFLHTLLLFFILFLLYFMLFIFYSTWCIFSQSESFKWINYIKELSETTICNQFRKKQKLDFFLHQLMINVPEGLTCDIQRVGGKLYIEIGQI